MTRTLPTRLDYGLVNEISRAGNELLGDRTGRTITQRTQDGMYNLTNGLFDPSGETMHGVMLSAFGGLVSKNKGAVALGIVCAIIVLLCWLAGKDDRAWISVPREQGPRGARSTLAPLS